MKIAARRNGNIPSGTLVLRANTHDDDCNPTPDDPTPSGEYGRVVHTYRDEAGDWNCHVAFFGDAIPGPGKLEEQPYILHYYATSLRVVEEQHDNG